MDSKDNLLGVIDTLWKWRQPIVILCLAVAISTAIVSLFLPNYYKATTTFLATSPDMAKPELLFGQGNLPRREYGDGNDIDRMLTIAESNDLTDFLIDSFQLYEHYKIRRDHPRARFRVKEKFAKQYRVEKTKRDAIELSVEDKDREISARIANAASAKIDLLGQRLIKEGQQRTIQTFETEVALKQQQLQLLGDTLAKLRSNYRIYNSLAQTEQLTAQQSEAEALLTRNRARLDALQNTRGVSRDTLNMLNAMVKGLEEEVKNIEVRINTLNDGIAPINTLERQYLDASRSLSEDIERLKVWRAVYEADIPAVKIIEVAETPIVKSRPKRSILVVAAGAIAFIFAVFAVLLLDNYQVDWRRWKR